MKTQLDIKEILKTSPEKKCEKDWEKKFYYNLTFGSLNQIQLMIIPKFKKTKSLEKLFEKKHLLCHLNQNSRQN